MTLLTTDRDLGAAARDAAAADPLLVCPECKHESLYVAERWPATLVDPAGEKGYCFCGVEGLNFGCPCEYEFG